MQHGTVSSSVWGCDENTRDPAKFNPGHRRSISCCPRRLREKAGHGSPKRHEIAEEEATTTCDVLYSTREWLQAGASLADQLDHEGLFRRSSEARFDKVTSGDPCALACSSFIGYDNGVHNGDSQTWARQVMTLPDILPAFPG